MFSDIFLGRSLFRSTDLDIQLDLYDGFNKTVYKLLLIIL